MINAYVDSVRPVPGNLVEEVAREFQLDEVAPVSSRSTIAAAQQSANTQALLENLDELLGRLRHLNAVPSRERKP